MKYIGKLLLAFLVVVTMGCSKDDPDPGVNQQEPELTGNWRLNTYTYSGLRTDIDQEDVTQYTFDGIGWEMNVNMELSESPNSFTTPGSYFVDHTVTDSEGQETLYYGYFDVSDTGTWTRTTGGISFTQDGTTDQGTITILTDNILEYTVGSFSSTIQYDGTIRNITRTDIYRFVRD